MSDPLRSASSITSPDRSSLLAPPRGGLYARLDRHEKDLIRHMHLEGNVVFPRAERLEVKVRSQAPRGSRRSV